MGPNNGYSERTRVITAEMVFEWLMTAMLIFTPFAFGTTEPWSREIFYLLVTSLLACWSWQAIKNRSIVPIWKWSYVPIILFLAFIVVQVVPLPADVVSNISPATLQIKTSLLKDVPNSAVALDHPTISFYATATREQLQLLLGVTAVFLLVIHFYRDPARIKRLLFTIACVGLAVGLLALYQNLVDADTVYGVVAAIHRNSGPFMNYSHFGQFMNLSIGAALGLLLVQLTELNEGGDGNTIRQIQSAASWEMWLLALLCILGPIVVFLSMTRMGMISLLLAGGFTGAMLAWRRRGEGKASLILGIGMVAFAVLIVVGFNAIYDRLATLRNIDLSTGGRLQMLKDMTTEFSLFKFVGTGLGTHEYVFPMFDHSNIPLLATHAENEYAQLLEETGAVGMGIILVFIAMMLTNYFKLIWRPREPLHYAAYGLGFGLLAILMHSATDFGQHVPAVAILTATSAALLINLADSPWKARPRKPQTPQKAMARTNLSASLRWPAIAVVMALSIWVLTSADRARRADSQWQAADTIQLALDARDWQGTNQDYTDLLTPATAAAQIAPDNVKYQHYVNLFRWHSISRVTDPNTHAVLMTDDSMAYASRIVDELQTARLLCPTYGPALSVAGQLEEFVLERPVGAKDIQTAFQLTPYDRTVCLIAGKLAIEKKAWDQSIMVYSRAAQMGGADKEIVDDYMAADRPDLAYKVVQGRREALQYLAESLKDQPKQLVLASKCRAEAKSLLLVEVQQPDAIPDSLADLAAVYKDAGDNQNAISWYRKALDMDYGNVDWRLQLAKLLADTNAFTDAAHQARICLHLRPQSTAAQELYGKLSVKAGNLVAEDPLGPDAAAAMIGAVQTPPPASAAQ